MKTITCRELGGPCDLEHRGETADDVIKANDRHLKDAEKAGDETHREAREAMKRRWRHPMRRLRTPAGLRTTCPTHPTASDA